MLFGAALTRIYADRFGTRVRPSENAVAVTPEAKARQGIPNVPSAGDGVRRTNPSAPFSRDPQGSAGARSPAGRGS
jgi:membrane protein